MVMEWVARYNVEEPYRGDVSRRCVEEMCRGDVSRSEGGEEDVSYVGTMKPVKDDEVEVVMATVAEGEKQ